MTRRSFGIGLFLSILAAVWPAWSEYIIRSSRADYGHLSAAILIPFLLLIVINSTLSRKGRGLSASELIVIVSMGMIAALAQGEWVVGFLLGTIASPTYFATAENGWAEALLATLPSWSIVADRQAATGFYEGLPFGAAFPWSAWWPPLLWWGGFLLAFFLANLCVVVIFRRQWMDHERLPYPIAVGLLEMTGQGEARGTLTLLFGNRLFWIGFGITAFFFVWDQIAWFSVLLPEIDPQRDRVITLARGFPDLRFSPNPMAMAFSWFVKSEVLFSIWAFHLLMVAQVGVMTRFGLEMGALDPWDSFHAGVGWQSFGGLLVFVAWGLWIARDHLVTVVRQALWQTDEIDDSEELMSYRTAVLLFVACAFFSGAFLWQCGLSFGPLLAFWGATVVCYLGFARIIVETGLVFLRTPITSQSFTWRLFGIPAISPASATALGLTYTFLADAKTLFITTLAHIPRLGLAIDRESRRRLPAAITAALIAGLAAVCAFTLYHGYYGVGTINFASPSYSGGNADSAWGYTASCIRSSGIQTDWRRLNFMFGGAIFTACLYAIRYRFPQFSLNPIGFAISGSNVLRSGITSVFLIWLARNLIVGLGGLESYRRATPFVMGMLLGYLSAITTGILVDAIWFPGKGHLLHGW